MTKLYDSHASRRAFLKDSACLIAGAMPLYATSQNAYAASASLKGLADYARTCGVSFGAAVRSEPLRNNPLYAQSITRECAVIVPENDLKWWALQPKGGQDFDFTPVDQTLTFADQHKLTMRGHTLIWHGNTPLWLRGATLKSDQAETFMRDYITSVAGRYKGKIPSWDVVNEAVLPKDKRSDGLRNTLFLDALGPRYLDLAFQMTHAVDPTSERVYNDYHLEYAVRDHEAKRKAVLTLLEGFRKRNIPCDTLGIQTHLVAQKIPFDAKVLRRFLSDVADMGYNILITELDVDDAALPQESVQRDQGVSDEVRRVMDVMLDEKRVKSVLTWGLTDQYTWLNEKNKRRPPNERARPLPLDETGERKPMWHALKHVFEHAPKR
jgi:endo-1,4-beta-xylanase